MIDKSFSNNNNICFMANDYTPKVLNVLIQQYLTDCMMEVSCLRYDGK